MSQLGDTVVPVSLCWNCGHRLDMAFGMDSPAPGDLTVCINCGEFSEFDSDLRLTKTSETDAEILRDQPANMIAVVHTIRAKFHRNGQQRGGSGTRKPH